MNLIDQLFTLECDGGDAKAIFPEFSLFPSREPSRKVIRWRLDGWRFPDRAIDSNLSADRDDEDPIWWLKYAPRTSDERYRYRLSTPFLPDSIMSCRFHGTDLMPSQDDSRSFRPNHAYFTVRLIDRVLVVERYIWWTPKLETRRRKTLRHRLENIWTQTVVWNRITVEFFWNYVHTFDFAPHNFLHNFLKIELLFQLIDRNRVFAKPRISKIRVLNSAFSNSFLGKITAFHLENPTSPPLFEEVVFILVVKSLKKAEFETRIFKIRGFANALIECLRNLVKK